LSGFWKTAVQKLLQHIGKTAMLTSGSERIPGKAYNVIARKGTNNKEKIVITTHIDSKKGFTWSY